MTDRGRLPKGIVPRLLSEDAAAAYLGVHRETFDQHIRPHVPPIEIGARKLWDIKALDHWVDQQSALAEALRPVAEWVAELGDDRAHSRR